MTACGMRRLTKRQLGRSASLHISTQTSLSAERQCADDEMSPSTTIQFTWTEHGWDCVYSSHWTIDETILLYGNWSYVMMHNELNIHSICRFSFAQFHIKWKCDGIFWFCVGIGLTTVEKYNYNTQRILEFEPIKSDIVIANIKEKVFLL